MTVTFATSVKSWPAGETLMVNELYVSLVYRPQPTAVGSAALKLFGRAESETARAELAESLEACEKIRSQVLAGLAAYEPEVLGLAVGEGGVRRSALLEFLGLLVNGERQAWALPTAPVAALTTTVSPGPSSAPGGCCRSTTPAASSPASACGTACSSCCSGS